MSEHHHEHEHHHDHDHCDCHDHEHHHGETCSCGHDHAHEEVNKGEFIFKLTVGGGFLVAGIILSKISSPAAWLGYVEKVCFIISYLVVGFDIVKEAIEQALKGSIFNENMLMSIASLGAFAIGEYSEGCAVMFLYTIGEYLQSIAVQRSRKSIKNMLSLKPQSVTVEREGRELTLKPEEVEIGDVMLIRAGDKLDIDGRLLDDSAEIDMRALTGESIPVSKSRGDEILAGSVNLEATIKVEAIRQYSDSAISKILAMIEDAEDKKSHAEQFISRFAKIYTPIVVGLALLIILIPPIFFGGEWKTWIYRGLSALVVSCPCALVISIPLTFFGGIGACSKEGILVKGGNFLEALAKVNTAVFDKTGTVTSGKFEYVSCECKHCHCSTNEHRELLRVIAACEHFSTHPIGKSVCLAFGQYAEDCEISEAKNYSGKGVSAVVDGVRYYVGSEKLMREVGVEFEETEIVGTALYCCTDSEFLGDIVFADVIKTDSREAIADLKKLGITNTVMLTGDKNYIAADIAEKAGIDTVFSGLLPDEKVKKVQELQKDGSLVLYTGDGINDAPVLACSDLGVAMGAVGSDVAIEASDMVIMGDSLSKLAVGRRIAKKTLSIAHQNIAFSLIIKLAIIIGCAVGIFNENAMWLAVFGDVGVCLLAVANSLRTMIIPKKK